jgi:hypothetical protein
MRMKELYEDTFGEAYVRAAPAAHSGVVPGNSSARFAHSGVAAASFAQPEVVGVSAFAHSGAIGATAGIAHSGVAAASFAHSGKISASLTQANTAIAAAQQSRFYSQRPRLTQPA